MVGTEELLAFVQLQPGSTVQVLEQQSPFTRFPSSHCSVPSGLPLPQIGAALLAWDAPEETEAWLGMEAPELREACDAPELRLAVLALLD